LLKEKVKLLESLVEEKNSLCKGFADAQKLTRMMESLQIGISFNDRKTIGSGLSIHLSENFILKILVPISKEIRRFLVFFQEV